MIYEYLPNPDKRREKRLSLALGGVGLAAFLSSYIPGVGFRALLQMLGVLLLTGGILVAGTYLLRSFCYTVAPREDRMVDAPDLTVTELCGTRRQVVCILSTNEVVRAIPCTKENRKERKRMTAGARCFRYVASLWDGECYLLEVNHEGERFFLEISANADLIRAIFFR